MAYNKRPDNETLFKVIKAKGGIMVQVANALGVDRVTVWNWYNQDEKVKNAFLEARESMIDLLESQFSLMVRGIPKIEKNKKTGKEELVDWIVKPDSYLIKFGLSTLGRDRGWVEEKKLDVTTKGESLNSPFKVIFTTEEEEENVNNEEDNIE